MGNGIKIKFFIMAVLSLVIVVFYTQYFSEDKLENAEPAFAQVINIQGEVQRVSDGSVFEAVRAGDSLATGDVVKTSIDSSMILEFADHSKIVMSADSQISMEALATAKESNDSVTYIRVDYGSVESRVSPQTGFGAQYKVVTPALQLAVRGTVFIVQVDKESGKSSTMVMEGHVTASGGGKEVELLAGFATVAEVGQPPADPVALLQAPELLPIADEIVKLPLQLAWNPVEQAKAYRLQLLAGPAYEYLVHSKVYPDLSALMAALPDAEYKMSLRGIDHLGLEGMSAEQTFNLNAHPLPPAITAPLNGAVFSKKKVKFYWDVSTEADTYLFQVSDLADFSRIVSQVPNLSGAMKGISLKLPPGNYYWRIASISEDNEKGPFTEPQGFNFVSKEP